MACAFQVIPLISFHSSHNPLRNSSGPWIRFPEQQCDQHVLVSSRSAIPAQVCILVCVVLHSEISARKPLRKWLQLLMDIQATTSGLT